MALTRRKLISWLLANGFTEKPGKKTSLRQFRHAPTGVVVTVEGKGRPELSSKHQGMLLRQLERAGFSKEDVRRQIG